jgi:hypothetical protein
VVCPFTIWEEIEGRAVNPLGEKERRGKYL